MANNLAGGFPNGPQLTAIGEAVGVGVVCGVGVGRGVGVGFLVGVGFAVGFAVAVAFEVEADLAGAASITAKVATMTAIVRRNRGDLTRAAERAE
ncbi:MAG: hypothetical protein ACHQZS_07360 [Candidatus Binatales bacterium]